MHIPSIPQLGETASVQRRQAILSLGGHTGEHWEAGHTVRKLRDRSAVDGWEGSSGHSKSVCEKAVVGLGSTRVYRTRCAGNPQAEEPSGAEDGKGALRRAAVQTPQCWKGLRSDSSSQKSTAGSLSCGQMVMCPAEACLLAARHRGDGCCGGNSFNLGKIRLVCWLFVDYYNPSLTCVLSEK